MNANIFLITFGSFLLVLCIKQTYINRPKSYDSYIQRQQYIAPTIHWSSDTKNPPPPNLSNYEPENKLYIMILDSEYQESKYHCIAKNQWIDQILKEPFIDGVEIYSRIKWTNKECNLSTVVIPKPPKEYTTINPTSWILSNALKMFINRSNSGWLFLIGDAAYMKVNQFLKFFREFKQGKDPFVFNSASGGCIDQRYFFQMFIVESGIIFSRKAIEEFLTEKSQKTWNVTYQIGLNSDEALSQISNENYISPSSKSNDLFLGREFLFSDDFAVLENIYNLRKNKNYSIKDIKEVIESTLPVCKIPIKYYSINPGMQGLCSKRITPLNKIIIWSGFGANKTKLQFLSNAERLISDLPDFIAYFWNPDKPQLCYLNRD